MFRRLATVAVAALGLLAIAAPASAHVTVNPKEATQGGYARLAFRVPTESDTAGTTKLEVQLPESAAIASVSTMPVPGWTVSTTKKKLDTPVKREGGDDLTEVVSVITWTADAGSEIKPGQFQEFPISVGPLPKVDSITFKALQTYSDGTVVRWIDEGANPEHPAPVLKLLPAAAATPAPKAADDSSESSGNGLALTALLVAILALLVGIGALLRGRSSAA